MKFRSKTALLPEQAKDDYLNKPFFLVITFSKRLSINGISDFSWHHYI